MSLYKFRSENMQSIKNGFLGRIHSDGEYRAGVTNRRTIRKSTIVAIAAAAIVFATTMCALAVGFNPIDAWQRLFEKEAAITVGEQAISAGISMTVQSLYTDGDHAILKMNLRDLEGSRLSEKIRIASIDEGMYTAYLEAASHDVETGEVTCIVKITFRENAAVGSTLAFTIDSFIVNLDYSDQYQPLDFNLYEAVVSSAQRPSVTADAWYASAQANPVPSILNPEHTVRRGGANFNRETNEFVSLNWMPLDTSVRGEELLHWLSVLGVGYEDGIFHVQLRYDGLFGLKYQYTWDSPVLMRSNGEIIEDAGEILYCGYQEMLFDVGGIEDLKDLKLAWNGNYAEYVIDGGWSMGIRLDSIGSSISGSVELQNHPDFTGVSYKLSPMYLETELNFPAHSLDKIETYYFNGREITAYGMDEDRIREKVYEKEFAIVLKNGTRIEPELERENFSYNSDASDGRTWITSWHLLDGSFDIEDVSEVIIFGVSIIINN